MGQFVLSRDLAKAAIGVKEKPCKRCGEVKPNTREYFGTKVMGKRTTVVTTDVCRTCRKAAHQEARQRKLEF